MDERAQILSDIRRLEEEAQQNPVFAAGVKAQITALCDRLKLIERSEFKTRNVV